MFALLTALLLTVFPTDCQESIPWQSIGQYRITEYCPACNEPAAYESASGKSLEEGDAACGWLPMGTEIRIDGSTYTIVDRCGTDAIDIFQDTDACYCSRNDYAEVFIKP